MPAYYKKHYLNIQKRKKEKNITICKLSGDMKSHFPTNVTLVYKRKIKI